MTLGEKAVVADGTHSDRGGSRPAALDGRIGVGLEQRFDRGRSRDGVVGKAPREEWRPHRGKPGIAHVRIERRAETGGAQAPRAPLQEHPARQRLPAPQHSAWYVTMAAEHEWPVELPEGEGQVAERRALTAPVAGRGG